MVDYGIVKSVSIDNDKDADNKKYICEVEFSDKEDIRTVQVMNTSGSNSRPMEGHRVLVVDVGGGFEVGICSDDNIDADLEDGEYEIYSIGSGEKCAIVKLYPDDTIEIKNSDSSIVIDGTSGDINIDSAGNISTSQNVFTVGNGDSFVALATKVDAFISGLDDVLRNWTVSAQDGGAALKAAYVLEFPIPPLTMGSSNLKSDE